MKIGRWEIFIRREKKNICAADLVDDLKLIKKYHSEHIVAPRDIMIYRLIGEGKNEKERIAIKEIIECIIDEKVEYETNND